jgi:hypothetical protein
VDLLSTRNNGVLLEGLTMPEKVKKQAPKVAAPMGRPSKYKSEYCDLLIEHMKKGFGINTFGALVDTCRDTVYEWVNVHPEFSDAYKRGREHYELFWERIGTMGTVGQIKGFNPGSWVFIMKNRFKWTDRTETTQTHEIKLVPMTMKEVKEVVAADPFLEIEHEGDKNE